MQDSEVEPSYPTSRAVMTHSWSEERGSRWASHDITPDNAGIPHRERTNQSERDPGRELLAIYGEQRHRYHR